MSIDAATKVDLNTNLNFDFSFGFDLTQGLAPEEAFFIQVDQLSANAEVKASEMNLDAQVGFLDIDVKDGQFKLNAGVNVAFVDPNGDGKITLNELQGNAIDSLIDLNAKGSVNGNLPVEVSIGSFTTDPSSRSASDPEIIIADTNIFDETALQITVNNFEELLNFNNISPTSFLSLLNQLGEKLQTIASSLNPPGSIPFVEEKIEQIEKELSIWSLRERE